MAIILNIETATQVCSVALSSEGKVAAARESREKNVHSAVITIFIEEVMKESGRPLSALDAVAVSMGPGSYTGLRIGVSTAKGICFALDKPLIAVGTLEAMAAGMVMLEMASPGCHLGDSISEMPSQPFLLCPMIDARRMEVYHAIFDSHLAVAQPVQAGIIDENSFADILEQNIMVFAGDGAEKCRPVLGNHPNARFMQDFFPSAAFMSRIAEKKFEAGMFENVAYFEPFYLKDFIPGIPKVKGLREF